MTGGKTAVVVIGAVVVGGIVYYFFVRKPSPSVNTGQQDGQGNVPSRNSGAAPSQNATTAGDITSAAGQIGGWLSGILGGKSSSGNGGGIMDGGGGNQRDYGGGVQTTVPGDTGNPNTQGPTDSMGNPVDSSSYIGDISNSSVNTQGPDVGAPDPQASDGSTALTPETVRLRRNVLSRLTAPVKYT